MVFEESVVLDRPFDEVLSTVKTEFAASGFGTLTEIDLQQTLHDKVGKEIGRYVIVGACNPHLGERRARRRAAHRRACCPATWSFVRPVDRCRSTRWIRV